MYSFIDTTETSAGNNLPAEAMQINGEYIEDLIPGYRTLHVSGREPLSPELATLEIGRSDGNRVQNLRYNARKIVVTYQLSCKSETAFMAALNALGGVLRVSDAEIIFADEPDKYFTGTPTDFEAIEPGRTSIVSSFAIYCADPFKYSCTEYEVEPTLDDGLGFVVDYGGTYKSFPTLEADFYSETEASADDESTVELTGNGDCGYVAFFNEMGKIIQLGDPEETDGEDMPKSQTLINWNFQQSTSWGTAAKAAWAVNKGVVSSTSLIQTGSPGIVHSNSTDYFLSASSFGSGTSYHGPSISRAIPQDESGEAGAANFTATLKHKMCIGSGKNDVKQLGAIQCLLTDENSKIIAGFNIYKNKSGKKANLRFYVNGKVMSTVSIDLSYNNIYFGANRAENKAKKIKAIKTCKTSTITKSGNTITFNIGGIKRVYRDDAIATSQAQKITVTISKIGSNTPLKYNGVYSIKFVKNNCDTWRDVPNKFSASDVCIADCKNGEIYLNDTQAPELGALGNDWEDFYLEPGVNQLGVSYSDWVDDAYAPTFKMRYREVFL